MSETEVESRLREYRRLADEYFQADEYRELCAGPLAHVDELMLELVESSEFDTLLVDTVVSTFPPHDHEPLVAHYRGLLDAWARDQQTAAV